jgi:multiple antibiotic resistance protein
MIFEKRHDRHERSAERAVSVDQIRNIAIFPARHPLIAGPGSHLGDDPLSGTYSDLLGRLF